MMISRIKSGRLHLDSGQVILRSGDYQHFLQSREITSSAHHYAHSKRAQADAAYDEVRRQGYQEGLAEGEHHLISRHVDFVRQAIDFTARLEGDICSLVKETLEKIVGEMDIDELTRKVVARALSHYGSLPEVKLRVAASQEKMVRAELEAMNQAHGAKHRGVKFIHVQADDQMRPGDCVLESPIGSVDAGLDTQLAAIFKAFDDPAGKNLRFQKNDNEEDEAHDEQN